MTSGPFPKLLMLFDIPPGKKVYFQTDNFECFRCGKKAKSISIAGETTDQYKIVKDIKRRLIKNTVKYGKACNCYNEIWMSNTEAKIDTPLKDVIKASLGINDELEAIKNKPFFVTVGLSEKGKKAGWEVRQDGIYTKEGTKVCDRVVIAR